MQAALFFMSYKFRFIEMTISDDYAYFKQKTDGFKQKIRWFRTKTIGLIWKQLIIMIRFQMVSFGFTRK